MYITSASFAFFVSISLIIYWKIPTRFQWIILLIDSVLFYFFNVAAHTFIYLAVSVLTVFFATKYFDEGKSEIRKKVVLIITLIINFGILSILKYTNLMIETVNFIMRRNYSTISWAAPLAISFYTLQIVAYLLNCYWKVTIREKNILKLLLFTSFFPLMISGPISSHQVLAPQLFRENRFNYQRVVSGLRRVAWGLAKKVVVADRMIIPTNYMFNHPDDFSGIWVLLSGIAFVIVLYFDFSGCMDIVIGVSKCFGIILEENFKAPFLSRSIQEFWQRWHITLGGWLKSFIMYPLLKTDIFVNLGILCKKKFGKQGKKIPTYIAMFAVWLLMGLWHGSSWKYIIGEGLWFWIVIVFGQVFEPLFKKIKKKFHINEENVVWRVFQTCRTVILYSIGMIFFNASGLRSAFYMFSRISVHMGIFEPLKKLFSNTWTPFGGTMAFIAVVIIGLLQIFCDIRTYKGKSAQDCIVKLPFLLRWISYFALVFIIILGGNFGESAFIYFGF